MNAKIYTGNIQPNPKEYKVWVNDEGTIQTWDGKEWNQTSDSSTNTNEEDPWMYFDVSKMLSDGGDGFFEVGQPITLIVLTIMIDNAMMIQMAEMHCPVPGVYFTLPDPFFAEASLVMPLYNFFFGSGIDDNAPKTLAIDRYVNFTPVPSSGMLGTLIKMDTFDYLKFMLDMFNPDLGQTCTDAFLYDKKNAQITKEEFFKLA